MRFRNDRPRAVALLTTVLLLEGAALLVATDAFGARPPSSTAVLELVPEGVPAERARGLSALLRWELGAREPFAVLDRSELDRRLDGRQVESAARCASLDCAVAIGRAAEVERVVIGRLERIDEGRLRLEARLVQVDEARALGTVLRDWDDDPESLREKAIPHLARELARLDEDRGFPAFWLFLLGGAGAAAYVFTRDSDGGGEPEPGAAEITGTFPPDVFSPASGRPAVSP